jgi:RNA polymerase primary sigma factor
MEKREAISRIADSVGRDERGIEELLSISQHHVSLDKEIDHDEDASSLADFIADRSGKDPESEIVDHALSEEIARVLDTLPRREAEVIKDRFGLEDRKPLSLKQIGERYKVSKERVRQIQNKALKKLKEPSRNARLSNFVN